MTDKTSEKILRELANKILERGEALTLDGLTKACREDGVKLSLEILAYASIQFGSEVFFPESVAQFTARLLQPYSPSSILDPWAGLGFFSVPLNQILQPERFKVYFRNSYAEEIWNDLDETKGIQWEVGDGLRLMSECDETYDVVVCNPPFGLRPRNPYSIEIDGSEVQVAGTYDNHLMLEACKNLAADGRAVFVSVGNFFTDLRQGSTRRTLARIGYRPTSAIELPAGTFSPHHNLVTHLIILERSENDQLFTGRFSQNDEHQKTLLKNLLERTEGTTAELGRWVDIETFCGFTAIELDARTGETARRIGLVGYPFSEVVQELNAPKKGSKRFEEKPNSVYLPQMTAINATTSQDQLPEKLRSYFQLVVNQDVADAEFLAGMLNTPLGQTWRDSLRSGTAIPRISKAAIETSSIFLPPKKSRAVQNKVVDCQHELNRLRNEIAELESQLWRKPKLVKELKKEIYSINREDRYEDWLDSLPFPLASILWACHTGAGSLKEEYDRKLHFFESLAQFLGIIYLSAFSAHEGLWSVHQQSLQQVLKRGNLSLERATFGTWKAVVELFSKQVRNLLSKDPELAYELFKTRDRDVLGILASKAMVPVIQHTNKLRNDWGGHTGAVSDRDAKMVNDKLLQHIQTVREIFGVAWTEYQLLLPGNCRIRGEVFHFEAKRIMGTRTPFPTDSIVVSEAMEDSHLYLKSPDEPRGLRLLPLLKVMPSPRTEDNACYFYNRVQSDGIRFLSYYFEADAEVVGDFEDVALAISSLTEDRP